MVTRKTRTMRFVLTIDCNGAAFVSDDMPTGNTYHRDQEVARILSSVAEAAQDGVRSGIIRDINGNRCGSYAFEGV